MLALAGPALLTAPTAAAQDGARPKRDRRAPQVWSVEIQGNYTFGDFVLNDIMVTRIPSMLRQAGIRYRRDAPVIEDDIRDDAVRIERFYQRRGFPEVRVSWQVEAGPKKWQRHVRFRVIEGRRLVLRQVEYRFDAPDSVARKLQADPAWQKVLRKQPFKKGRRFEPVRLGEFRAELEGAAKDAGYAFATVRVESENNLVTGALLTVVVQPGVQPVIDSVRISGFKTVPESFVRREMDLKSGQRYTRKALTNAQRDLYSHHLFRYATVALASPEPADTVQVTVQVAERALRSVEVRAGVGNEDLLRTQVSWTHRNLLGRAHSFTASGKTSFIEQRIGMAYVVPYVFNNRSSASMAPFAYHLLDRSFELWSYGINQSLIYQVRRNLTLSAGFEYTRNDETLPERVVQAATRPRRDYNLSSITLAGFYDAGYLTDGEGLVVQPTYQYSGLSPSTDFHFQKLSLDLRYYTRVAAGTELAARISPGVIFDIRRDTLPNSVEFYLGGANSIRGFSRQFLGPKSAVFDRTGRFLGYLPTGGTRQFGFNLEIRQRAENMGRGLGLALFLDGGQVWDRHQRPGVSSLQYAAGSGIRWKSPVGPVRFDIGYKLNPRPEDLNVYAGRDYGYFFDRFGFHISIGQAF